MSVNNTVEIETPMEIVTQPPTSPGQMCSATESSEDSSACPFVASGGNEGGCPPPSQQVTGATPPCLDSDEEAVAPRSSRQRSIVWTVAAATTALAAASCVILAASSYDGTTVNGTNTMSTKAASASARLLKNNKNNKNKNKNKNQSNQQPNQQSNQQQSTILKNVGSTSNLELCEGDCDDDDDCMGYPALVCYQRDAMEIVPGCTPGSGSSLTSTDVDFCIKPNFPILRTMSSDGGNLLGQCEGYCSVDSDCQDGLKCAKRSERERVPGCDGTGSKSENYCYDEGYGSYDNDDDEDDTSQTPSTAASPQQSNSAFEFDTFSFHVLGDIPYSKDEEKMLEDQLQDIGDNGDFVVHVGDIMYAMESDCEEWRYERVSEIFQENCGPPVLITPGDNEYGDCSDNEEGMNHWHNHLGELERRANWKSTSVIPSLVVRQQGRNENFAFVHKGVLFLAINMIYGKESGWASRIEQNRGWVNGHINSNLHGKSGNEAVRAVVMFAHSASPFSMIKDLMEIHGSRMKSRDVPFIFLHGNGHSYQLAQPFKDSDLDWPDFYEIQVDRGRDGPPVEVTIQGNTQGALNNPLNAWNSDQRMLGDFIKLDRQR